MNLYPDLFSGVGTIKNAMVHLDVKPGAIPVVCSPHHLPHAAQPKLKQELDRMLKLAIIRKLDINEASDWVHALVIVIKPNAKLHAWGRFCFMKLPFGLCESQYFFQCYMDLNFENLTNAHIIADDVLIVGSDLGPSDDHDHDRYRC